MSGNRKIQKPNTKKSKPKTYVHVNEFLMTRTDLTEGVKAGFKVFMKNREYQFTHEDFEKHLKSYFQRNLKK